MTIMLAFDADQDVSRVLPKAKADGVIAVCRYLGRTSAGEIAAISAEGMSTVSVFETTANRALGGSVAGALDGSKAVAIAIALKQPLGSAIYVADDQDTTIAQQPAVLAYFAAFKTALNLAYAETPPYKLGVYANGAICQAALDQGIADYAWLAGGMGMRGSRDFAASGRATMIQDVGDKQHLGLGIAVDSDEVETADYGGWAIVSDAPDEPLPIPYVGSADILPALKDVQAALKGEGLYKGAIDGLWGPRTAAAFAAYYASR
jgi:hypothetical protein